MGMYGVGATFVVTSKMRSENPKKTTTKGKKMNIPNKLSLTELESLLKSDNEQELIEALMYAVFNIDEPRWIQEKCHELIYSDKSLNTKGLAITCLGHVARIHGTIDKNITIPLLIKLSKDHNLSGRASDALDDIEQFVKNKDIIR